jgi:hypothetical protein
MVIAGGFLINLEESLLPVHLSLLSRRQALPGKRNVVSFSEIFEGLRKLDLVVFHPEGKNISSLFAPETVKHLPGRAHRERWVLLRVERAEPYIVQAGSPQLDISPNHFNDINSSFDFFLCSAVSIHWLHLIPLKQYIP